MSLSDQLESAAAALEVSLTAQQRDRLLGYVSLLARWNKAFNLTAVREPGAMISHHIADSLAVLPYLAGETVLDVGSGAGLPGIPLAIADPGRRFVLLDSNGKKVRFLRQAILELKLDRIELIKSRIEQYRPPRPFDTVISRAFNSVSSFFETCAPACGPETRILAMKGRRPDDELRALPPGTGITLVARLWVPGLSAQRHLIGLKRTGTHSRTND